LRECDMYPFLTYAYENDLHKGLKFYTQPFVNCNDRYLNVNISKWFTTFQDLVL